MEHCTSQPNPPKTQKNSPRKKFLILLEMELSSSNIKKILIFSQKSFSYIFSKESFSYISENGTLHFSTQARKIKEIHLEKNSCISGNENPEKTSYIFLKRKLFLCFGKREPRKNSLYFRKQNFSSLKNEKKPALKMFLIL